MEDIREETIDKLVRNEETRILRHSLPFHLLLDENCEETLPLIINFPRQSNKLLSNLIRGKE